MDELHADTCVALEALSAPSKRLSPAVSLQMASYNEHFLKIRLHSHNALS